LVRVSIVSNNPLRVREIAKLLAEEDRIGIVDAPDAADVVIAAGVPAQDLPPHAAVVFVGDDLRVMSDGPGRAWLPTQVSSAELIAAVMAAAQDLTVLTPEQARRHLSARVARREEREVFIEPLTPRELQVLKMLAAGLANKEIAGELGISDHTAKFHVAQILAKLDAGSRAEAVAIAIRQGLIPI
jgi:two-component system nitrate/nitrite response regulator NarL